MSNVTVRNYFTHFILLKCNCPTLCNQASFEVPLLYIYIYELILHNWLIALFFSLDANCAAGELENVSQHCWFECVSAKKMFSTILS